MSNQVNEAIAALRMGDQAKAQELLGARLDEEPNDAMAWLWMSEATPDVRRKVEALSRFLALEPTHTHAASVRGRLQQLQAQLATMPPADEREEPRTAPPATTDGTPPPSVTAPELELSEEPFAFEERAPSPPDGVPAPARIYDEEPDEIEEEGALASHAFSPRPAAPPPPNFQTTSAPDEDSGLPMWVWLLMVLSLALVALFIYLILNFEQFAGFLP